MSKTIGLQQPMLPRSLPAPTLPCSQSTTSIVSNLLVSGGPAKADDLEDKLSKFDKHFKTQPQ